MFYGVVLLSGNNDLKTISLFRSQSVDLLFLKGAEAVFICEHDAFSYGYEQSERRKVEFDPEIYNIK